MSETHWYDTRPETIVAAHDLAEVGSLSEEIAVAVEEHSVRTPGERRSLGEYIDPDALDRLFVLDEAGEPRVDAQLEFRFDGYRVHVDTSGLVRIQRTHRR